MNPELVLFLLKKSNVPNATKSGLVLSWVIFKGLDVKGRVFRAMHYPS